MNKADALVLKVTVENQQAIAGMAQVSKATQDTAKTSQASTDVMANQWSKLSGAWVKAIGVIGSVTAAMYTLDKIMVRTAAGEGISNAFDTLTSRVGESADVMLSRLRPATRGLISDMELMRQTNAAIILGLPVTADGMATLSDAAVKLGRAMGVDAKTALESLIIGIGRQSRLWLDNIGIVVDADKAYRQMSVQLGKSVEALTDAERKLAFYNETLKAAKTASVGLTVQMESEVTEWQRIKTAIVNATDAFLQYQNKVGSQNISVKGRFGTPPNLSGQMQTMGRTGFELAIPSQSDQVSGFGDMFSAIENSVAAQSSQLELVKKANEEYAKGVELERKRTAELLKQTDVLMSTQAMDLGGTGGFGQSPFAGRSNASWGGGLFMSIDEEAITQRLAAEQQYTEQLLGVRIAAEQDWSETREQLEMEQIANRYAAQMTAAESLGADMTALIQAQETEFTSLHAQYSEARSEIDRAEARQRIDLQLAVLGQLASTINTAFGHSKKGQIAVALINTYAGITQALAAYPPPYSFIMAALVAAQGFAQVSKIQSTNIGSGGGGGLGFGGMGIGTGSKAGNFGGAGRAGSRGMQTTAPGGGDSITIVLEGDGFIYSTPEELARQIEDAMRRARGRSGGN